MITFLTDQKNDLYISPTNSVTMASGIEAISAACKYATQTMAGELVLQGDEGVPNFATIWGGAPNIPQAEAALRETLLAVDGVEGVTSLTVFVQDGVFRYNAIIQTNIGEVQVGV